MWLPKRVSTHTRCHSGGSLTRPPSIRCSASRPSRSRNCLAKSPWEYHSNLFISSTWHRISRRRMIVRASPSWMPPVTFIKTRRVHWNKIQKKWSVMMLSNSNPQARSRLSRNVTQHTSSLVKTNRANCTKRRNSRSSKSKSASKSSPRSNSASSLLTNRLSRPKSSRKKSL